MGCEVIGAFGTHEAHQKWTNSEMELAIKHIIAICGEPPAGVKIELQPQHPELDSCPAVVVAWDDCTSSYPAAYIHRCAKAYEDASLSPEMSPPSSAFSELLGLMEILKLLDVYRE